MIAAMKPASRHTRDLMPVGGKDCRIARRTIQVLIVFMVLLASLMVLTMRVQAKEPQPTPTVDRLAQPTLPVTPSQADLGAVEYWFACMVCHGDRGQGLTEEWRAASGPDDMNCWQSRCHASNHPPEGFELPLYAPMVIGEGALGRFDTAADLYEFISTEMPWQAPGVLDQDIYWQLTAFLLRENGFISGQESLGSQNADRIYLHERGSNLGSQVMQSLDDQVIVSPTATLDPLIGLDTSEGLPFWVLLYLFGGVLLLGSVSWPFIMANLRRDRSEDQQDSMY